jgi:hypothetical protein
MAKISARGAHKVAQANKQWQDDEGYDHKVILALRSDGKVLRKHSLRSPFMRETCGSRGWNEGGYSIMGALMPKNGKSSLDRFRAYAEQNGYTLKETA